MNRKLVEKFVTITIIGFVILVGAITARAQEEHRWTINAGGGFGVPVAGTSSYVGTGGNFQAGGGYNWSRIIGLTGEFMWQGLPVNANERFQIGAFNARSNLYSVTGNIMLRAHTGGKAGAYAIGGTGWYRRSDALTRGVIVPGTVCSPAWNWWVPVCFSGLVPAQQVVASRSSDVLGANGGAGVTYRLGGEGGMKVYAEARFHYAPTDLVFTRVISTTFGLRW
ncbi:MAG: outer membrane beta-barrel protein [Blastocatellia bacterium]|nr:outer membrane beta-barrel protein [Blastocatellia bacterium]